MQSKPAGKIFTTERSNHKRPGGERAWQAKDSIVTRGSSQGICGMLGLDVGTPQEGQCTVTDAVLTGLTALPLHGPGSKEQREPLPSLGPWTLREALQESLGLWAPRHLALPFPSSSL